MGLNSHTMVIKEDGSLWGWGSNTSYELGIGSKVNEHRPVKVSLEDAVKVICSRASTFFLDKSKRVIAWGHNGSNDFGLSSTSPIINHTVIAEDVKDFDNMLDHSALLKENGDLLFSGSNYNGQFGDGTKVGSSVFVKNGIAESIVSCRVGAEHTVLLTEDGRVLCAGGNGYGQIGDNSNVEKLSFYDVGLSGIIKIFAGPYNSFAVQEGGILWGWGNNNLGSLGLGDTTSRKIPTIISSDVKFVSADVHTTTILKEDGTVWTAGYNNSGQIGNGAVSTTNYQKTFLNIMNDVKEIASGESYGIALKNNGTLWAWGLNNYGQLGDGTGTNRPIPQQQTILGTIKLMGSDALKIPVVRYLMKTGGSVKFYKDDQWHTIQ